MIFFFHIGAHFPQEIANGDCCEADEEDGNLNGGRLKPESNLVKNKRLKHMNSGMAWNGFHLHWNKMSNPHEQLE